MRDSYFDRLIEAVEDDDHGVFVRRDDGSLLLGEYHGERFDPPLLLDFTADELDATVRETGRDAKTLWPEVPEPEAGYRLLLVHLDESLNGMRTPTRRVYLSQGQIWAE